MTNHILRICTGNSCRMNFSKDILKSAEKATVDDANIEVESRNCLSQCKKGPNVEVVNVENQETLKIHNGVMEHTFLQQVIKNLSVNNML